MSPGAARCLCFSAPCTALAPPASSSSRLLLLSLRRAATQITCTLGASPAGTHTVLVFRDPFGYAAWGSATVTVPLVVSGVAGATSPSLGGGASVVLSGSGFSAIATRNQVRAKRGGSPQKGTSPALNGRGGSPQ